MTTLPSPDIPFASYEADRTPPPTSTLPVQAGPAGIRTTVTVRAGLCLDNSHSLRHALRDAPMRSAEGVDLDLSELHFVDCSALNELRRALRTHPDIDLTHGIPMVSFGLNPDEAWQALVMASQNTKLHRLAEDVVPTVQGAPLPEPVQHQLTAAVTRRRNADGGPAFAVRES